MEAYCVKCKEKQEVSDPQAVFTSTGTPATKGVCSVCGTNLFRMGRTDAHEGMTPPEVTRKPRKKKKGGKKVGKLVIVESPAKARTVGRYLGKGYTVVASVGHVRDLLRSQLSVDVEHDFTPKYRVPNEKRPIVKEIKAYAQGADQVYIATDPDREGEAIAWHLMESAEIDPEITHRVVFHEITRQAIEDAFSHPRGLNEEMVDAQQARRILDRLVGFSISPILWSKVRGRLSGGRVQSVALRLIVEREREIEDFVPVEYWSIKAEFLPDSVNQTFIARLRRVNGTKPELNTEGDVKPLLGDMETAHYHLKSIKKGTRTKKPSAPFITSTLQQDASRRLNFTARRTMSLAQQLYQGIDLPGKGATGLITYMRTDSTNVSKAAQAESRKFIEENHGKDFLPEKPPFYRTKAKRAQEAHEAIRPTSVFRTPASLKKTLTRDQHRLYRLIWQRFVASQMASAVYNTLAVEVLGKGSINEYLLRASGSNIRFKGFLVVYEEAKGKSQKTENGDTRIPDGLEKGQRQTLQKLIPEQHFTAPPPRYSDATLVSTLEENGIGRPSTYAAILSTLQNRGYIFREGRRLTPTETGFTVNDLLTAHFPDIVDIGFTARMESDLDRIAAGDQQWVDIIREFYSPFSEQVERAKIEMPEVKVEPELVGRACPDCGNDLLIRWGRHGKFIGCSNFPKCRFTEPLLEKIGVICPDCGGELVQRKTRKGRTFFGCEKYPACEFTSWKRPLKQPCPVCSGTLVASSRNKARCLKCEEQFFIDQLPAPADKQ